MSLAELCSCRFMGLLSSERLMRGTGGMEVDRDLDEAGVRQESKKDYL